MQKEKKITADLEKGINNYSVILCVGLLNASILSQQDVMKTFQSPTLKLQEAMNERFLLRAPSPQETEVVLERRGHS